MSYSYPHFEREVEVRGGTNRLTIGKSRCDPYGKVVLSSEIWFKNG